MSEEPDEVRGSAKRPQGRHPGCRRDGPGLAGRRGPRWRRAGQAVGRPVQRQLDLPAQERRVHAGQQRGRRPSSTATRCPTSSSSSAATGRADPRGRPGRHDVRPGHPGPGRCPRSVPTSPSATTSCAGSPIVPIPSQDGKALLVSVPLDAEKGAEASGETSALVEGATAIRDQIESVLVPAGLDGYVGGPGGLIADFAAAFAGIDGILLGVALLVVLVILLIVYRSPILPFAVLLSAVFGLSAASLVVYQLALNDVITLSGPVAGHPVHPRRGRVHRLRAAAGQPLQGGAARRAELVGGPQAGLAGLGRADRRVGRDRHPRPALPAARRAAQHLGPGPGGCPRHRGCAAGLADLPPRHPPALRPQGVLAVRAQARPRARRGRRRHQGAVGPRGRPRGPAPAAHLGHHARRAARRRGVRADLQGGRLHHRRDLPRRHRLDHRAAGDRRALPGRVRHADPDRRARGRRRGRPRRS